ncbi:PREDICTED: uncharacterized protein LOC104757211 [Camelina sativa]|uniref:Uncharacterized protein LOC104757211 n=1 Tax=Camelina sativa TaxID=90675 RepID=A0ABM1R8C3_CAMSA|nr:PREDICTED: uncharacterized protein LOC104757211 [Camelina sativa]
MMHAYKHLFGSLVSDMGKCDEKFVMMSLFSLLNGMEYSFCDNVLLQQLDWGDGAEDLTQEVYVIECFIMRRHLHLSFNCQEQASLRRKNHGLLSCLGPCYMSKTFFCWIVVACDSSKLFTSGKFSFVIDRVSPTAQFVLEKETTYAVDVVVFLWKLLTLDVGRSSSYHTPKKILVRLFLHMVFICILNWFWRGQLQGTKHQMSPGF